MKEDEREGVVPGNNFKQINKRVEYYECNFKYFDFASEYITGIAQYVVSERKEISMLIFRNGLRKEILKLLKKKKVNECI